MISMLVRSLEAFQPFVCYLCSYFLSCKLPTTLVIWTKLLNLVANKVCRTKVNNINRSYEENMLGSLFHPS